MTPDDRSDIAPPPPGASAPDALAEMLNALSRLVRGEIALARAEVADSLRAARSALIQLLIAAAFALAGIILLALAAVQWMISAGLSPALAGLVAGVTLVVLAAAFGQSGQTFLRDASRVSRRSAANLKRDIETLQTMGDSDGR